MTEIIQVAALYAVVVVAAVEALKAKIPQAEGAWTLALAAGCTLAIVALFMPLTTGAEALHAGRVAMLAWLVAVGGDKWMSKLAGKAGK